MKASGALVAAALLAGALGCASKPRPAQPVAAKKMPQPKPRPLCSVETAFAASTPLRERTFLPQNWFTLLLHAYRSTGELPRPLNDCTGTTVMMVPDGCTDRQTVRFTPTALGAEDLVVTAISETERLVWVMTERLSDGQAQGPVAVAELEPRGIAVRAMGTLRVYPGNVTLRLERLSGATVLVADGQRCDDSGRPENCDRAIRIVPLVGERFISTPIIDGHNSCVGSSLIPVRTRSRVVTRGGTKYELEAAVTLTPNAVLVREQLALIRLPPGHASKDAVSESFVTRQQLERQIVLRNGHLITDGPSLLNRWLAQRESAADDERDR